MQNLFEAEKPPIREKLPAMETPVKAPSMIAASCYKPKGNPYRPDGEDSHFICPWNQTIGVADGVGGWASHGIDSGEYSRGLIGNIIMAFVDNPLPNPCIDSLYLSRILDEAYGNTNAKGSSTLCLIALSGHDLVCLNVGDSGFRVIRNGKTVYASTPQVSRFNCPYQLGLGADKPSIAVKIKTAAKVGDVVVVGSDGLFDNVFDWELEDLVNNGTWSKDTPQGVAEKILEFAYLKSIDTSCRTPFSVGAQGVGRMYSGGKRDDITVVLAYIV